MIFDLSEELDYDMEIHIETSEILSSITKDGIYYWEPKLTVKAVLTRSSDKKKLWKKTVQVRTKWIMKMYIAVSKENLEDSYSECAKKAVELLINDIQFTAIRKSLF